MLEFIKEVTPGNSLPSKNSKDAPPPVDTCVILSSKPILDTASTVDPPPIIVIACVFTILVAIAFVPEEKLLISNTPIGPFHKIKELFEIIEEKSETVEGPISINISYGFISDMAQTLVAASDENLSATTTSLGRKRLPKL